MNRYFTIALMTAAALMWNCSGTVDPDDNGKGEVSDPTQPYTLSVDKTAIEADGNDAATFKITDANGLDLTGSQYIKNTSFQIEETGEIFSGMAVSNPNRYTSIDNGTYTVTAMFAGKKCSNTVSVKVQNRSKYEVFRKNAVLYRLTATWCPNCPSMTKGLTGLNEYTKSRSIVMGFHNGDEFSIPYPASGDIAAKLDETFGKHGYPYCIYSLAEGSGDRSNLEIQDHVKKQLIENPAKTGIKASSSLQNNNLTVNASVKASSKGTYDLGVAVIRNNCKPTSASANESIYNNVVVSISENFLYMSKEAFALDADQEKQLTKEIDIQIPDSEKQNYRIVLFTLKEKGGKILIDNGIEISVGGSADYSYN